jgi:hypothetical protein
MLSSNQLEAVRPRIRSVLEAVASATPIGEVPLVKDPRLSLFLSELPSMLAGPERLTICVRHPLEVARSLAVAHDMPVSAGLALWEIYNCLITTGLAGRPARFFSLQRALEDPHLASALTKELGLGRGHAVVTQASGLLVTSLRRQRADVMDERRWLSVAQRELWEMLDEATCSTAMVSVASVSISAQALDTLDRLWCQREARAGLQSLTTENQAAQDEIEALRAQLDLVTEPALGAERQSDENEQRMQFSMQQLLLTQAERDNLRASVETLQLELADVRQDRDSQLRRLTGEHERARALLDENARLRRQLDAKIAECAEHLADEKTKATVADLASQLARVAGDRDEALAELVKLDEAASRQRVSYSEHLAAANSTVEALLVQLDATLTLIDEVRRAAIGEASASAGSTPDDLRSWLDQVVGRSEKAGEAARTAEAEARRSADLMVELHALQEHRDEVVTQLNAICRSESWRIGHALTWPARKARLVLRSTPRDA